MLNKIQREKYIEDNGRACPHCASTALQSGEIAIHRMRIFRSIICLSCANGWRDIYSLSDILPDLTE